MSVGPKPLRQLGRVDAEHVSDSHDVVQREVRLPSLDASDERPVEAGPLRQALLRQPKFVATLPHSLPKESGSVGDRRLGHDGYLIRLRR